MSGAPHSLVQPIDLEAVSRAFRGAEPFPYVCIEPFLDPDFAREVSEAYPDYESATREGRAFKAVNENLKVQICEEARFPEPVRRLSEHLRSDAFVDEVSRLTGIEDLVADPLLAGGGMHVMGGDGGRLDVHVDFNLIRDRGLYRRLNILVFLNEGWREEWGGTLELWDRDVRRAQATFAPVLNRCVLFETSETSFHGVTKLRAPHDRVRKSFAAYYYTREAPAEWSNHDHTTIFRARPDEVLRRAILMPAERAAKDLRWNLRRVKRALLRQPPPPRRMRDR